MTKICTISNIKRITAAAFLSSLVLSYPLWASSTEVVANPIFKVESRYLHVLMIWMIFLCLVTIILLPMRRGVVYLLTTLLISSVVLDINRAQIWLLHFLLLLWLPDELGEQELATPILFMVAITYVCSGIHKFNPDFRLETVPWLIRPFGLASQNLFGLLFPVLEISIGLLIMVPFTSRFACFCAAAMHLLIVAVLMYYKWNFSVVPWNILLAVVTCLIGGRGGFKVTRQPMASLILIVAFLLIPILGISGVINRYWSFPLYSGNNYTGIVVFSDHAFEKLPDDLKALTEVINKTNERFINLDRYAMTYSGAPLYQDLSSFKNAATGFVKYASTDDDMILLVRNGNKFEFEKDMWAYTISELK